MQATCQDAATPTWHNICLPNMALCIVMAHLHFGMALWQNLQKRIQKCSMFFMFLWPCIVLLWPYYVHTARNTQRQVCYGNHCYGKAGGAPGSSGGGKRGHIANGSGKLCPLPHTRHTGYVQLPCSGRTGYCIYTLCHVCGGRVPPIGAV